MEERLEIIDNNGVIYSGNSDWIMNIWNTLKSGNQDEIDILNVTWEGDLKLINVIDIIK